MHLPPRSFYSLTKVAARWTVTPFNVIGWATDGHLTLSIALPPGETCSVGNDLRSCRYRGAASLAAIQA